MTGQAGRVLFISAGCVISVVTDHLVFPGLSRGVGAAFRRCDEDVKYTDPGFPANTSTSD